MKGLSSLVSQCGQIAALLDTLIMDDLSQSSREKGQSLPREMTSMGLPKNKPRRVWSLSEKGMRGVVLSLRVPLLPGRSQRATRAHSWTKRLLRLETGTINVKTFLQVENSGDISRKTQSFAEVADKSKSESQKLLENCCPSLIF